MTKQDIENLIVRARQMATGLLAADPDDDSLPYVVHELDRIKGLIGREYPLGEDNKATIDIGLWAVRELEGLHDELADLLEEVDYQLTSRPS